MLIKYLLYINLLYVEIITTVVVIDSMYIYPDKMNKIANAYNFQLLHDSENTINIRTIIYVILLTLDLNNFNDDTIKKIHNTFKQIKITYNINNTKNNKIRFLLENKKKIYNIYVNNSPKGIEKKYLDILFEIKFRYYIMIELFQNDTNINYSKRIIKIFNLRQNYFIYEPTNNNKINDIIKSKNSKFFFLVNDETNKIHLLRSIDNKKPLSNNQEILSQLGFISTSIPINELNI